MTSFRPQTILATYVAVSLAIVLVAFYYYWGVCQIKQEYYGGSLDYCPTGVGFTPFNPLTLILFVPVGVSMTLVIFRVIHWQTSATLQRSAIFVMTTASEVSLILIILGSQFEVVIDHEHAGKQCGGWVNGIPPEYQQSCNMARATANFSSSLLPIQVASSVAGIVLTYLYWRYYGRVAPVI